MPEILTPGLPARWPYRPYRTPQHAYRAGRRHALAGKLPAEGWIAWPGHYRDGYDSVGKGTECVRTGERTVCSTCGKAHA